MAIDMGGLAFGRTGDSAGCTLACARDVRRKRNEILTPPLLVLQSGGRVRNDPPLSLRGHVLHWVTDGSECGVLRRGSGHNPTIVYAD
jgi:hypothetical protein